MGTKYRFICDRCQEEADRRYETLYIGTKKYSGSFDLRETELCQACYKAVQRAFWELVSTSGAKKTKEKHG